MPSLPELQRRFAAAILAEGAPPAAGLAIYRNAVTANYRKALGATYRVVSELTGIAFFNAAVDAFVLAQPSSGGDLNVYGGAFGSFLAAYPHAAELPDVPDVARLEWALDVAHRAADAPASPARLLAALGALPADDVPQLGLRLDPSCRLLASPFPVLRIWQVHQPDAGADASVTFGGEVDRLLVHRAHDEVVIERRTAGDYAFLDALDGGAELAAALDAAIAVEAAFDLGAALRTGIASGVISDLRASA
jgi:hypothetical protein